LYLIYVLLWPDDGCFTAETCRLDVIDILSQCLLLITIKELLIGSRINHKREENKVLKVHQKRQDRELKY